jgi:hypothetical protein
LNEQTAAEAQTLAKEARSVAEEVKTIVKASDEKFVTSGEEERIKVAIGGICVWNWYAGTYHHYGHYHDYFWSREAARNYQTLP